MLKICASEQQKTKIRKKNAAIKGRRNCRHSRPSKQCKLGSLVVQFKEPARLSNHLAGYASQAATADKLLCVQCWQG